MLKKKAIQPWTEMAKKSITIFDLGANAGIYSLAAAPGPKARIHAFEPTPDIITHIGIVVQNNHFFMHERLYSKH